MPVSADNEIGHSDSFIHANYDLTSVTDELDRASYLCDADVDSETCFILPPHIQILREHIYVDSIVGLKWSLLHFSNKMVNSIPLSPVTDKLSHDTKACEMHIV